MASNPPFRWRIDDEDFFDKLVDDDDEYKVTPSVSHSFVDGNDSDEAKAFANLSIAEDLGGEGGTEAKGEAIRGYANAVSVDKHVEESSLVSSNSFEFDSVIESNGVVYLLKVRRDLRLLQSAHIEEIVSSSFQVIHGTKPKQKVQLLER
ncbi:hypothetical protein LOK49_LG15G02140 [Camellia lanceoleosa]|uniref:Uncharacterized protein n=1 Tax=Camellia lanceoleosa TaxID=1840588 RepID=A0ACC0F340_9ERIC|nr:hypothetical protein LOK49_LG15G02140 [Camellia lanceoleosa]